jgi:hypothetical protein
MPLRNADRYVQHSAHIAPGRDGLFNLIRTLPDTLKYENQLLCSESRRQLIRRFSAACVLAEDLEGRLARGEEIDVERHALLCSTLTRLAQRIGIDRRALSSPRRPSSTMRIFSSAE